MDSRQTERQGCQCDTHTAHYVPAVGVVGLADAPISVRLRQERQFFLRTFSALETIQEVDNIVGLFLRHDRMTGKAEFPGMNQFRDRETQLFPLPFAALLTVRRDGIVNQCCHAVLPEISLQAVALLRQHREYMPHTVTTDTRNADQGIFHLIYICSSNFTAMLVLTIEKIQFYVQHGSLQFVNTRITSEDIVHILLLTAVISQGTHHLSQRRVVRGHRPGIAESAKVLARIETMPCRIAQRTGMSPLKSTAMRLGIVLNEFQMMLPAQCHYPLVIGTTPVKMDYHHGAGTWSDGLFYPCVVHQQRVDIRLHQHRFQFVSRNRQNTGNESVGRNDHLITFCHYSEFNVCPQDECQSVETISATDTMRGTD